MTTVPGTLSLCSVIEMAVSPTIVTFPRVFLAGILLLCAPFALAEIGVGDSRSTVIQQIGEPTSHAQRGSREILNYPRGGRIELVDGKVVSVKGPLPTPIPSSDAATNGASAEPALPTSTPSTTPAPKATSAKPAPSHAPDEPSPAVFADAIGKHIEKMDTAWGERPQLPSTVEAFSWPKLLVEVVLHFGITLLALKIAFKIEEMDAFWSGVLAIAGIDVGIYATLEALGPFTSGISSVGAVESGIGALVMIGTIQKFCFNKRIQNAVITAMSVKLIVRLCHMFLFVLVINALFG